MYMKITRLALPGKCGARGASESLVSASICCNTAGNNIEPAKKLRSTLRREQSQEVVILVDKNKLIAREQYMHQTRQHCTRLLIERHIRILKRDARFIKVA